MSVVLGKCIKIIMAQTTILVVFVAILGFAIAFDCPSGDQEKYYAHPTECGLFYQCSNGVAILQQCPPGLYFDTSINVCDGTADCGNRTTSTPTGQTTSPMKPTSAEPSTEPTKAPSTVPSTAPTTAPSTAPSTAPTTEPSTLPSTAPSTAPTTVPSTAPSTAPTTVPSTAPTTAPSTAPTTAPSTAPTTAPSTAPTTAPTRAPSTQPPQPSTTPDYLFCENTHSFFLKPYPPDCTQYVSCDHGIGTLMPCPPELYFDTVLYNCLGKDEAHCSYIK